MYEGQANSEGPNGWGRCIQGGFCYIGWWKNGEQRGNCRIYRWNQLDQEGWF